MFKGRQYSGNVEWEGETGKMLRITLTETLPGDEPFQMTLTLSRYQIGILSMFDQASEVTRPEIYYYLSKIWGEPIPFPIPTKYTVAMVRLIKLLKQNGLIVEMKRKTQGKMQHFLYRTMRGQAVWTGTKEELQKMKLPNQTENPD